MSKTTFRRIIAFGLAVCLLLSVFTPVQAQAAGRTTVVTFKGKSDVNGKKYTVKVTFDKKSGEATKVTFKKGKKSKTFSDISSPGNDPSVYWSDDMNFCMCIWYQGDVWTVKHVQKIVVTDPTYSGTYKKK